MKFSSICSSNVQVQMGQNKEVRDKPKSNSKVSGALSVAGGAYIGGKAITSGIPKALGVRLETHTTSGINAKSIIKNGCILDPKFGGTGAASLTDHFTKNSKNFVHITGLHKSQDLSKFSEAFSIASMGDISKEKMDKVMKSPLKNPIISIYSKLQRFMYKTVSFAKAKSDSPKSKNIFKRLTDLKPKTFYIAGTDKFFNDNFIPDVDDIAMKTDKPLKVFKTKIGATINSLKRHGLSGIKQNKSRVALGLAITGVCLFTGGKLIKSGLEKMGVIKNKENVENHKNTK